MQGSHDASFEGNERGLLKRMYSSKRTRQQMTILSFHIKAPEWASQLYFLLVLKRTPSLLGASVLTVLSREHSYPRSLANSLEGNIKYISYRKDLNNNGNISVISKHVHLVEQTFLQFLLFFIIKTKRPVLFDLENVSPKQIQPNMTIK